MGITPFNEYLGIRLVSRGDGIAEVAIDLAPHHLNRRGVVHGGVIAALLDSALGAAVVAAIPDDWWCATTSLSTQFLEGAGEGHLTAVGRVVRRGARVAFATGEARGSDGRLVATAGGTWHLWPYLPGAGRKGKKTAADETRLSPPAGLPFRVGKIVAVGRNYAEHVREMGAPRGGPPELFLKPSTALVGDGATISLPPDAGAVHHEVELVAVIGRAGRHVPAERALEHVHGFAVGLDLTLRDLQAAAKQRGEPWSVAKGFDGSAPVSGMTPRDEVGDGSGLRIELRVNGEQRQQGNTSQMLHGVAELVALASRWMTLEPGDLIFTGTPAGVGPIRPGDRLEAEIERVGRLEVTVAENAAPGPEGP